LALLAGAALLMLQAASHAQNAPVNAPAPDAAAAGAPAPGAPAPSAPAPTAPANLPSQTPLYDPAQLPELRGQVRQFTLTPRGDIDGLILVDGTEVKTPPHLSSEMAYAVKPGDTVVIHGLHAAALPLMRAVSVTDEASKNTVIDNGPPPGHGHGPGARPPGGPGKPPPLPRGGMAEATGSVRMSLHGPEGDIDGALLDDGTVLRLPPPEAHRLASLLRPGQTVFAQGPAYASSLGKVIAVERIGTSRDQLDWVAPPPPPPHHPAP
jgi:hypothetical protein